MQSQSTNRIYAPILVGIALLIGIFGVRPLYETYLDTETEYARLVNIKSQREATLAELQEMQKNLSQTTTWATELAKRIGKLSKKWDPGDVMAAVMLNDYTKTNAFTTANITIGSIAVDKWVKLPSGISLGSVSFQVTAISLDTMVDYITYLTQSVPYAFTINEVTLPLDSTDTNPSESGVTLALSLGVYYYE